MITTDDSVAFFKIAVPGTYVIDPAKAKAEFNTKHMFGLGAVRGTFNISAGTIVITDGKVDIDVSLDAASFQTGQKRRDTDVRSAKFLNVTEHPTIAFHAVATPGSQDLTGALSVRGITENVEVQISALRATSADISATGTARIDRYALGITAAKGMAARYLDFTVEITAELAT
jgi:polyisoprenoid-binding protein YceI